MKKNLCPSWKNGSEKPWNHINSDMKSSLSMMGAPTIHGISSNNYPNQTSMCGVSNFREITENLLLSTPDLKSPREKWSSPWMQTFKIALKKFLSSDL